MMILMLTKEDFYSLVETDYPAAFRKFGGYIDDFKASTNWNQLFHNTDSNGEFDDEVVPKFHDIPFALQKGVVENFFVLENIQYYPTKHPFNPSKWTFHTIDTVSGAIWTQFTDPTHQVLAEYNTSEDAEIGAIRIAFQVLDQNLRKNLN